MPHDNVLVWNKTKEGIRPCDWCGKPLENPTISIHPLCLESERRFYTQIGYDGGSDVILPKGYNIVIPK